MHVLLRDAPAETAVLAALAHFEDVSPQLLAARALQQRVDRKFLMPQRLLQPLLARMTGDYRLLRAGTRLVASYETRYFDTPERAFYDDHRRGRCPRYKVRIRHHLDRRLSFLEVKRKHASRRTTKARLELPFGSAQLDLEATRFLDAHSPVAASGLVPCVSIAFRRVTLVGAASDERVTLDWDIEFSDDGRRDRLSGVVIAEIKQGHHSNISTAVRAFRALHLREQAVSKYCVASARLGAVRTNIFKPILRAVERVSE